jgi:hypothetical protein
VATARRVAGVFAGLCVATTGVSARADPQASVGLTAGGEVEDASAAPLRGSLHLGLRGDLLQRTGPRAMGFGGYLDAATASFDDLDLGGGVEWLVPMTEDLPLVLSGGAFARDPLGGATWRPGVEGSAFVGSRSFNYHSWYGLAAGLFAQTRWVPGPTPVVDVILGAQIDTELLVLPWWLLWQALKP